MGISKEYNVFELQDAFAKKDRRQGHPDHPVFRKQPQSCPDPADPAFHLQFLQQSLYDLRPKPGDEKSVAATIGVNPYFVKDYLAAVRNYGYEGIEGGLLLLHSYNLKSIGIGSPGTEDASLLKELVVKMMS